MGVVVERSGGGCDGVIGGGHDDASDAGMGCASNGMEVVEVEVGRTGINAISVSLSSIPPTHPRETDPAWNTSEGHAPLVEVALHRLEVIYR